MCFLGPMCVKGLYNKHKLWSACAAVCASFVIFTLTAYWVFKVSQCSWMEDWKWTFWSLCPPSSEAAPSFTGYQWWSIRWTARVRPASIRPLSGETQPGIGCPQPLVRLCPEARPLRVQTGCSASRSSSSTRRRSLEAPPSIGSCQTAPGSQRLNYCFILFIFPNICFFPVCF